MPMTADPAAEVLAARLLMAFTFYFHIVLVPLGVAFPFIVLIANYIGLKRNDQVALTLAKRWSQVIAVLFAVGVVSGTVLSFELGPLLVGRRAALRRGWRGILDHLGQQLD